MIEAIIIDDEKNNIDNIHSILKKYCPYINIVGSALNGTEAKNVIQSKKPALLFLDIQMPEMSGLQFTSTLKNPPSVILTTAFREYAPEAFELNAVDYLLKPIDEEELSIAISKFKNQFQKSNLEIYSN